jgi:hypothetical protein
MNWNVYRGYGRTVLTRNVRSHGEEMEWVNNLRLQHEDG